MFDHDSAFQCKKDGHFIYRLTSFWLATGFFLTTLYMALIIAKLQSRSTQAIPNQPEEEMKPSLNLAVMGLALACFSSPAKALNDAPADADTVMLRIKCIEGGTEIPNCFESMDAVDTWLRTTRLPGPTRPTLVNIGPGDFSTWQCGSSNVTLRGSGRDQTVITATVLTAISVNEGCTNLNVHDLTLNSGAVRSGVTVYNLKAKTTWTNVEIISQAYGWDERFFGSADGSGTCGVANLGGKHMWFSSRIRTTGLVGSARAYTARCAESWFWGSEISSDVTDPNASIAFALKADQAEIHLYGSNVSLRLPGAMNAQGYQTQSTGHFLMAAINGSEVHIHGTGLDVIHNGIGIADMLYADANPLSHFHATASGFNIHVSGAGKVKRLAGPGKRIEAPYTWGESTTAPFSTTAEGTPTVNGVGTLISRSGADRYTETDCQPSGNCSSGGGFPHDMVYLASCTGLAANQGPWFDMTTKACRQ